MLYLQDQDKESEQLLEVASTTQQHEVPLVDDNSELPDYEYSYVSDMFPWNHTQVCFLNLSIFDGKLNY